MERTRMVGYPNMMMKNAAFVAPTHSTNHSMLHPSSSFLPPPLPPQVKKERGFMEASVEVELPREAVWPWKSVVGDVVNPDFSVDDLLDFEGVEVDERKDEDVNAKAKVKDFSFDVKGAAVTVAVPPPVIAGMDLPTHDPEEFEWMSSIIDDSLPPYPPTSTVPRFTPTTPAPPQPITVIRARRSSRSRTPRRTWPGNSISNSSITSSTGSSVSSSSSHANTNLYHHFIDADYDYDSEPKKRGRKPKHQVTGATVKLWDRECTHCKTRETPQWRAGPEGPKTLCNACGVRYKSGRLVPEYRPSASPTFVPEVHSSSHRRVMQLRQRKEEHLQTLAGSA